MRAQDTLNVLNSSSVLRRNFSWAFAGNIAYRASQWGILVVVAKFCGAGAVGDFAYAFALVTPVFAITNCELRQILATDSSSQFAFADYFWTRALTSLLSVLIATAIACCLPMSGSLRGIVFLLIIAKAFECYSDILYGNLERAERIDIVSRLIAAKGITTLIALAVVTLWTRSLIHGMFAWTVTWVVRTIWVDVPIARRYAPVRLGRFSRKRTWQLITTSWPLGISMGLVVICIFAPRYFVISYCGRAKLGYFVAVSSLIYFGDLAFSAATVSLLPRFGRLFENKNWSVFRRRCFQLVKVGGLVGLVGTVSAFAFGAPALRFLYGAEYTGYGLLAVLLFAAQTVSWIGQLDPALKSVRATKTVMFGWALNLTFVAVACLILVPRYQLMGAGFSVMAGCFVRVLFMWSYGMSVLRHAFAVEHQSVSTASARAA